MVSVVAYNVTDAFIAAVRSADHCMPADGEELVYAVERTLHMPKPTCYQSICVSHTYSSLSHPSLSFPPLSPVLTGASCPVIWLRAKVTYLLPREILVRRFVTVIGHPLALPIIDAHTIIRAFMVEAGGYLDCRFAVIKRGRPVEVIPDLLYELKGSAVYVRLGGEGTSCMDPCLRWMVMR